MRQRHDAARTVEGASARRGSRPWRDGFLVGVTNPKSLVFLAVLLPGFVKVEAATAPWQILTLGSIFCLIAVVSDGTWAILAARARPWLASDPRRLSASSVGGGLVMVALGLRLVAG